MIYTSSFAAAAQHPAAVAISRGVPKDWQGRRLIYLAPHYWSFKLPPEAWKEYYEKNILSNLDPQQVLNDLGPQAVLLCWEGFNVRCHRRLVAEWLETHTGIVIPELGFSRQESMPFDQQPRKGAKATAAPRTLF